MRDKTARFIERARTLHGDRYDYSKVDYRGPRVRVVIICPKHGDFTQTPELHLRPAGCRHCAREKQSMTLESFLRRARERHGDRFDYSRVRFQGSGTPVEIVCSTHGPFEQTPNLHLRTGGCRLCGQMLTAERFVADARRVHGDRYDYGKVVYIGIFDPVVIRCELHGEFRQRPSIHKRGAGCPACGALEKRRRSSLEEFVAKAEVVHGDTYDYSQADFINNATAIMILCGRHGAFNQRPQVHLLGHGCPACADERQSLSRLLDTPTFISKAKAVHGDRYDYGRARYEGADNLVKVTCMIHGDFNQRAALHLRGQGCKECQMDAQRLTREAFIEKCHGQYDVAYDYFLITGRFVLSRDRVWVQCPEHGRFQVGSRGHMEGRAGCPSCHGGSRCERAIARLLDTWGIAYEPQWGHETLRDKGRLRFDFAIVDRRVLIEFDGPFHFRPIIMPGMTRADAERALADQQRRDRLKNEWAAANGWQLIRLSRDNRIEEDLRAALDAAFLSVA